MCRLEVGTSDAGDVKMPQRPLGRAGGRRPDRARDQTEKAPPPRRRRGARPCRRRASRAGGGARAFTRARARAIAFTRATRGARTSSPAGRTALPRIPSSISSLAAARRGAKVCKEVAAQTAAGLFSVLQRFCGRVDVPALRRREARPRDDVRADIGRFPRADVATRGDAPARPPERRREGRRRRGDAVAGSRPPSARVAILLRRALQHASLERLPGCARDGATNGLAPSRRNGDGDGDGLRGRGRAVREQPASPWRRGIGVTTGERVVDPCPISRSPRPSCRPRFRGRRAASRERSSRSCWTSTARRRASALAAALATIDGYIGIKTSRRGLLEGPGPGSARRVRRSWARHPWAWVAVPAPRESLRGLAHAAWTSARGARAVGPVDERRRRH